MGFVQGVFIVILTSLLGLGSCFDLYSTTKYVFKKENIRPEKSKQMRSEKWLDEIKAHQNKTAEKHSEADLPSEKDDNPLGTVRKQTNEKYVLRTSTQTPKKSEPSKKVENVRTLDISETQTGAQVEEAIHKNHVTTKTALKKTVIKDKSQAEQDDKALNKKMIDAGSTLKRTKQMGDKSRETTDLKAQQSETSGTSSIKKLQSSPTHGKTSPKSIALPTDKKLQPESISFNMPDHTTMVDAESKLSEGSAKSKNTKTTQMKKTGGQGLRQSLRKRGIK